MEKESEKKKKRTRPPALGGRRGSNSHLPRVVNIHPSFFPSPSPTAAASRGTVSKFSSGASTFDPIDENELVFNRAPSVRPAMSTDVSYTQVGSVYAFGLNNHGQLGLKDFETRLIPTKISEILRSDVQALAAGSRFSLCLTSHGQVHAWGKNEDGQCGQGSSALIGMTSIPISISSLEGVFIVKIAARGSHALALARDGKVYAWGKGDEGQLGLANSTVARPRPVFVETLSSEVVVDISAGRVHSVAVTKEGLMYTWGSGEDGATGLNTADITLTPTLVDSFDYSKYHVDMVACGSRHTLCVASERDSEFVMSSRYSGRTQALFSFGSNSYGQLGLNDTVNRFAPTQVMFHSGTGSRAASDNASVPELDATDPETTNKSEPKAFSIIACGYRHSCVVILPDNDLWCFGWNAYGQTGTRYGISNVTYPSKVDNLPKNSHIEFVAAGGRHTLVSLVSKANNLSSLWAFGKGDEGALGTADLETTRVPREVSALSGKHVVHAACGWSHSLVVAANANSRDQALSSRAPIIDSTPSKESLVHRGKWFLHETRLFFSLGNLDGAFAQFLNMIILFLLMRKTFMVLEHMPASTEASTISVTGRILPGAAVTVFLSNLFFALWAGYISYSRRIASLPSIYVTALPHGLNTIIFLAFATSIVLPVLEESKDPEKAYRAGLFSCFVLGVLELPCVFFVEGLRKIIPRAALMSAIGGVSLVYIAMSFALEIFESPLVGIIPFMIILVGFAARVRFPLRIPAGLLAMTMGVGLAWIAARFNMDDEQEMEMDIQTSSRSHVSGVGGASGDSLYEFAMEIPAISVGEVWASLLEWENYKHLSIIFPMLLVNVISNLSCVESAESLGDSYNVKTALLADAVFTIIGALLGNPVPTCLYLGFPAFKSMGARTGYSAINAFLSLFIGMFNGIAFLGKIVPEVSGVGMLLWIGIMVVTRAFHQDERQQYESHAAAVAIGIIPALAAWAVQLVKTVLVSSHDAIASSAQCSPLGKDELDQHLFERVLVGMETRGTYILGMISLSKGWLLSSVFLSSTVTHLMEREFLQASMWMVLASALALVGFVHAYQIDSKNGIGDYHYFGLGPSSDLAGSDPAASSVLYRSSPLEFFFSYLGCALILLICEIRERDRSWSAWISKIAHLFRKPSHHLASTTKLSPDLHSRDSPVHVKVDSQTDEETAKLIQQDDIDSAASSPRAAAATTYGT